MAAWLGMDGYLGAGLALHHPSFDPYGGHEMVQQHHNHKLSHASKQHQLYPRLGGNANKVVPT
jgi:hypothetical protein